MEECAYKRLEKYKSCHRCFGRNPEKICYITQNEIELHLQEFQRLFPTSRGLEVLEGVR